MNDEEIRSTIEQIKAQVKANPENAEKSDDEIDELILDSFFKSYTEGEMTKEDLLGLAQAMGYEPDEGFENDPNAPLQVNPDEGGEQGGEGGSPAPAAEGGASEEALEATRTMEPGESQEEFQNKIDAAKEGEPVGGGEENKGEGSEPGEGNGQGEGEGAGQSDEDDEEAERKAASELWKMDLSKK